MQALLLESELCLASGVIALAPTLAFAAIDTDQSSQQWRQLDELTSGLGARRQALQKLNAALADRGLSYDADVKPAVGKELDVAVLKSGDSTTPEVVAFGTWMMVTGSSFM